MKIIYIYIFELHTNKQIRRKSASTAKKTIDLGPSFWVAQMNRKVVKHKQRTTSSLLLYISIIQTRME